MTAERTGDLNHHYAQTHSCTNPWFGAEWAKLDGESQIPSPRCEKHGPEKIHGFRWIDHAKNGTCSFSRSPVRQYNVHFDRVPSFWHQNAGGNSCGVTCLDASGTSQSTSGAGKPWWIPNAAAAGNFFSHSLSVSDPASSCLAGGDGLMIALADLSDDVVRGMAFDGGCPAIVHSHCADDFALRRRAGGGERLTVHDCSADDNARECTFVCDC